MDLKSWSDLIYRYYFERSLRDRVILHISMSDLIDFVKDEDVEFDNGEKASSCNDSFIINDFVRNFWISPDGNEDLRDLENRINQIVAQAVGDNNHEILLSVLAILIMPICENDDLELHGNNYYGHLLPFLFTHRFINNEVTSQDGFFAKIKLDRIWNYVNQWAESKSLPYRSAGVLSENGNQYVNSLKKESLLSPSRIQRFCILFDKAGFDRHANIEDDRLFSAFKNYYAHIGISPSRFKQLTSSEYRDFLLTVLRDEFDNWDGNTKIKERDRRQGKTLIKSGNSCYSLLLQMSYDIHNKDCSFAFQLYCQDVDDAEYKTFISDSNNNSFPEVYIKPDGYANKPFRLEESEIQSIFSNRQGTYSIHEDIDKSIKGRHAVTDYYILRQYKNAYIATNKFIKGEFYFVVIRHDSADDFASWLDDNKAECITDSVLGGYYSVYRIRQAVEGLSTKHNLSFKQEVRCESVRNLEVKTSDDSRVICLSKLLPAQFEITGIDVSKDRIYAVSVNAPQQSATELNYDHEKELWVLDANSFQSDIEFQLYCNESPIPYGRTYKFIDFILPESFKELSLDQWGHQNEPSLTEGLELSEGVIAKNLINWEMLNMRMQNAVSIPINNGDYKEKDYLLYAITSASYKTDRWVVTKKWLQEIKKRLDNMFASDDSHAQTNDYQLDNALADYFRMGYINYAYSDGKLHMTANRPTLILLAPKFERTVTPGVGGRKMVSSRCVENSYKCLLTGGRTIAFVREIETYQNQLGFQMEYLESPGYLHPQTVFIHAAERSVFEELARKCNLLYQDNIYANALIQALPSIEDYISAQREKGQVQREKGKELDLFGVRSFRSFDYQKMAELYPQKLARGQAVLNREIEKESFSDEQDVVTFFPGSTRGDETTVMIEDGHMVEIDKYWGHFVGMYMSGTRILQYDEDRCQIWMPQQFRLPLIYARALTLLNGKTPNAVFGSRTYSLDVNPWAGASKPEIILKKLGQQ